MKQTITLLLAGIFLFTIIFLAYRSQQETKDAKTNSLTFSNTMQWDPALFEQAHEQTYYVDDWQKYIVIPSPPSNTSEETKTDIATMLSYKALRTPEKIQEIKDQADFNTLQFNGHNISDYFDATKFPLTSKALSRSFRDISDIVLSAKLKFNRVRPSVLEPSLDPVIPIPGHPSYPSGHSTQSYFLAYFFAQLEPQKKDKLLAEASNIAKNREIAGLHYPSDTAAGKALAEQFMTILLKNKEFVSLLEAAKKEWPAS